MEQNKILVAYFSASGITAKMAKEIAMQTGADIFEIEPEQPYTSADLNWNNKKSRSTVEMENPNSRPAIKSRIDSLRDYEAILIGFPIWWYVAPTIINTFLESYDFAGKKIALFATSGGSGMGKTEEVLKPLVSEKAEWLQGKRLANSTDAEKWAKNLNL